MCTDFAFFISGIFLLAVCPIPAIAEIETDPKALEFTHLSLQPRGAPDLEIFDDLNGDGHTDILLTDGKVLFIFMQVDGTYSDKPSFRVAAPEGTIFMDVGDVEGRGKKEVVFLGRDGISRLERREDDSGFETKLFFKHANPFLPSKIKKLAFLDFLQNITGDEVEELMIPESKRFVVYERTGQADYQQWAQIPFRPRGDFYTEELSQTGRLKEVVHIPRLFTAESQGTCTLVLYDGVWVTLFEREPDGSVKVLARELLYEHDPREYEEESRAYFGKNLLFEDLAGKGTPAIIVAENRSGKLVFHKGGNLTRPLQPNLTLQTDGWILKPVFQDMNDDGLKDLILPSIEKIGVFTILRIFFTSRFDIRYMIFYNRTEPLFKLLPDVSRSVSLPLRFTAGPEGVNIKHTLVYTFEGDFNGDGLGDFLHRCAHQQLGIYYGRKGSDFSEEPDATLDYFPLEHCSSATTRVFDLNRDGISDLFLHQKSIEMEEDRYDVYLSRK
jgi:hypothetical protein